MAFGLAAVLAVAQSAWFLLSGPPQHWGNEVRISGDVFTDSVPEHVRALAVSRVIADTTPPALPDSLLAGRAHAHDIAPELDRAVVITSSGQRWIDDQRMYVRAPGVHAWQEISSTRNMMLQEAKFVITPGDTVLLVTRWRSWYPYQRNYIRFLRSIINPELRAEYGVYRVSSNGGDTRYLFPGYNLVVSPDRRRVAYFTSTNGFSGRHNLWIYDAATNERTRIVSIVESDPGSGRSFDCRWTADSRAVIVHGRAQQVGAGKNPHSSGALQLIYVLGDRLYDVGPGFTF